MIAVCVNVLGLSVLGLSWLVYAAFLVGGLIAVAAVL